MTAEYRDEKQKKISKRIVWADEVGEALVKFPRRNDDGEGTLLTVSKSFTREQKGVLISGHQRSKPRSSLGGNEVDEGTLPALSKSVTKVQKGVFIDGHQRSKSRGSLGGQKGCEKSWGEGRSSNCPSLNKDSYKEVLLRRLPSNYCVTNPQHVYLRSRSSATSRERNPPRRLVKRCYRCLASDHLAAKCRDPIRCYRYGKTGHRAHFCREKSGVTGGTMNKTANDGRRAPLTKVFVLYTEEYIRRVELWRNAILTDIIRPANLGLDPITTIKTALASCFGGYKEDFAVARYRERDYAIFLPEWVPAALLIRREVLL